MTAAELRWLRSGLGISQKQLANMLGVTNRTVIRWEAESTPIGLRHERAIHDVATELRAIPAHERPRRDPRGGRRAA